MKKKKQKCKRYFVQLFVDTMESPAWLEMTVGARALYIALKKRYNRKTQGAVFLSTRNAAKELKSNRDSIIRRYRELEHFGFVTPVKKARLDREKGKATLYRLADEPYEGKPPSMEFSFWNGVSFTSKTTKKWPLYSDGVALKTGHCGPLNRTLTKSNRRKRPKNGGSAQSRVSGFRGHNYRF
jgi:DNA-binding transcriptional MocR family regulator